LGKSASKQFRLTQGNLSAMFKTDYMPCQSISVSSLNKMSRITEKSMDEAGNFQFICGNSSSTINSQTKLSLRYATPKQLEFVALKE